MKRVVRKLRAFNNSPTSPPPTPESEAVKAANAWLDTYSKPKPQTLEQPSVNAQRGPPLSVGIPEQNFRTPAVDNRSAPPRRAPRRPGLAVHWDERLSLIPREGWPEYDSDDGLWLPPSPSSRPADLDDDDDLDDDFLDNYIQVSSPPTRSGGLQTPSQMQAMAQAQAQALARTQSQPRQPPAPSARAPPSSQQTAKISAPPPPAPRRQQSQASEPARPPPPSMSVSNAGPVPDVPPRRIRPPNEGAQGIGPRRRSITAQELLSMTPKDDEEQLPPEIEQFLKPARPAPRPPPPSTVQSQASTMRVPQAPADRAPPSSEAQHKDRRWHLGSHSQDKGDESLHGKRHDMPEHPMNALAALGLGVTAALEGGGGMSRKGKPQQPPSNSQQPPVPGGAARPIDAKSSGSSEGSSAPRRPHRIDTDRETLSQRAPLSPAHAASQSMDAGSYRRAQQAEAQSYLQRPGASSNALSPSSSSHGRSISDPRAKGRPNMVLVDAPPSGISMNPISPPSGNSMLSPNSQRGPATSSFSPDSPDMSQFAFTSRSRTPSPIPPTPPSGMTPGGNAYTSLPTRPPPSPSAYIPSELAYLSASDSRHGHDMPISPRSAKEATNHDLLAAVFPMPSKTRKEEDFTFGSPSKASLR